MPNSHSTPRIPLRDFFRNPAANNLKISPGGTHIAVLRPHKQRMNIFVRNLATQEERQVTFNTDRNVGGYFWKTDRHIIFVRDQGGDENYRVYRTDLDGGDVQDLTPFEGVRALIADDLRDEPDYLLVALNQRIRDVFDVYRLNIHSGELEMIAENSGKITSWMTDHNGDVRLAEITDGVEATILVRDKVEDEFRPLIKYDFTTSIHPLFYTFDNKHLYALSNRGRDTRSIVIIDGETGEDREVLFELEGYDVGGLAYSQKRKVLQYVSYTTWKRHYHFLDAETEELHSRLAQKLPDVEVVVADSDLEEEKFIIRTYSDRSLGAYYLYVKATDELTLLDEVSPWLNEADMCRMQPLKYRSRDGLTIHGYLTLPQNVEARQLPVVLLVHGGPWLRDSWGYRSEVQFLANRGYAVMQVNFRGSTGYGRKFWQASFKEWGGRMQDDLTDGVQYLIDKGIADPARVAIYGGSYGGYAVLAGLCFTPELYACGIDFVGVSNLLTFMDSIPPYWRPVRAKMHRMIGNPETETDFLRSRSPVFHVDAIKSPLLVAQGAKDPRVNINESNQIVEALRNRGIDVPYIVKENEGHGFHNEENRLEFFAAMEQFLHKHIGAAE